MADFNRNFLECLQPHEAKTTYQKGILQPVKNGSLNYLCLILRAQRQEPGNVL